MFALHNYDYYRALHLEEYIYLSVKQHIFKKAKQFSIVRSSVVCFYPTTALINKPVPTLRNSDTDTPLSLRAITFDSQETSSCFLIAQATWGYPAKPPPPRPNKRLFYSLLVVSVFRELVIATSLQIDSTGKVLHSACAIRKVEVGFACHLFNMDICFSPVGPYT